jgi:hypothetical protein
MKAKRSNAVRTDLGERVGVSAPKNGGLYDRNSIR